MSDVPIQFPTTSSWTSDLRSWLSQAAEDAGFASVGVATVDSAFSDLERPDATRFQNWLDLDRAGEMEYLKRRSDTGDLLRSSVQVPLPWAQSVVLCAFNYNAPFPSSTDPAPEGSGWIGRYAWSGSPQGDDDSLRPADYHEDLLGRLRHLEAELSARSGCQTRCYVDTGPMVERTLAARAGLGWIGKNTCVLNQELGSWVLLAALVTSLRLPLSLQAQLAVDRCGSCTQCLDACPTQALVSPHEMDASRCIAYLTIEKKREIPQDLRPLMGRQVFGCDICQDVCPWNRGAPTSRDDTFRARADLVNPSLAWLAGMDASAFRATFAGSPLERTGRKRLHRNVAIAMGNSGDRRHVATLEAWANGDDPTLAEAAAWALLQIISAPQDALPDPEATLRVPRASAGPDPLC